MKAYAIIPAFELYSAGVSPDRSRASVSLISKMTFDCLRSGDDRFQFAVDWKDPGSTAIGGAFRADAAEPHLVRLHSDEELLDRIQRSVDPNDPCGGTLRSAATCRAVTFGLDGQAFVCLRHEDPPPVSMDTALAVVSDATHLLVETDYFDGFARD